MPNITNELINNINSKCKNGWKLDVDYYLFHNEKTFIKRVKLDDEHYLEFALRYNYKNQISLHISKFYQEKGKSYASTSGMGKSKVLDETSYKRKTINNLIEITKKLTREKLLEVNSNTRVSNGYGLIMPSKDF